MTSELAGHFPEHADGEARFSFGLHGISLELPRSILTPDLWQAFKDGYYEGLELAALQQVIRPGDAVLEIGAGVGFISAYLLRVLHAARVWAVEAESRLVPIINRTHELNATSAVIIHGVACNRDGSVIFHQHASFWASSVIPESQANSILLPGVNISRLVLECQPDVMVVDIEGGEIDLFEDQPLTGVRSLVVEVHQGRIGGRGIARCFAALHRAGFAYDPKGSQGSNVVFSRM